MDLNGNGVYRGCRIHSVRLPSGVWVASIVKLGVPREGARALAGPPVERVRGEYPSEVEAVSAARQYIDRGAEPPESTSQ